MDMAYHQNSDGTHIISVASEKVTSFAVKDVIIQLADIHYQAHDCATYVVLNFGMYSHLPLREFVMYLKQFYKDVSDNQLSLALVVDTSQVRVLEAVVKTLVTRETIQYFTDLDKALLWLSIERSKSTV